MAEATGQLCDDHANGWSVRYSGKNPPRFGCPECWKLYEGDVPGSAIEDLTKFSKLDDAGKRRVLLGKERFSIVGYDLECTHLKPNIGRIICCSFKPLGGKVYTFSGLDKEFRQKDVHDDGPLAVAIRNELEKYDIIVGHNSRLFDTKFLNSRLLRSGERIKKQQYQVDTMWAWRSKASAWSGLAAVQQFIDNDGPSKTVIDWRQWMRALGWDKELREAAAAEIIHHCELDVKVLERAYRFMVEHGVIRGIRKDGGIM
jgi:DNA polymerase elongation subunit (family B)